MIKRGEIYYADLEPVIGSEQGGNKRPVLIIQNNTGNRFSITTIVALFTTKCHKNKLPTHIILQSANLPEKSMLMLEQLRTVDTSRLSGYIGRINNEDMKMVDKALIKSLAIKEKSR